MELLGWIFFGFLVGLIARALLPGRDPLGLVATTVLGVLGAVLGGWAGRLLGLYAPGARVGFLSAILGAVLVLTAYNALFRRRRRRLAASSSKKPATRSDQDRAA